MRIDTRVSYPVAEENLKMPDRSRHVICCWGCASLPVPPVKLANQARGNRFGKPTGLGFRERRWMPHRTSGTSSRFSGGPC
jgi:hypothetical protein